MNTRKIFCQALGGAVLCVAAAAASSACYVDAYPVAYADVGEYPPAAFIATASPVYYEGHAAYFYNGRWFYRDGARWGYYRNEPPGLAGRRGGFVAGARVNYGRGAVRGRVVVRAGRR